MMTLGSCNIKITIHNDEITHKFVIIKDLANDGILGADFISDHNVVIEGSEGHIGARIQGKSHLCTLTYDIATVHPKRNITLPPQSITPVDVTINGLEIESLEANILVSQLPNQNIKICEGLLRKDKPMVAISNVTHEPIELVRNDVIGSLEAIDTDDVKPLDKSILLHAGIPKPTPQKLQFLLSNANLSQIPPTEVHKYRDLILKNHDIFSSSQFDLGRTGAVKHKITMDNDQPVHVQQFRIPYAHEKAINDFVDELLKKGCITPSSSPYNSPIFAVKKKDGSLRCVLDYRMINLHSQEDKYVIRSVQQSIDEIGKNKSTIFTCADLSSSFWQQELEPRSRPMTAFSLAGRGRFEWVVTPMGLKGSPASFSRLMDHVMNGLEGVITYIDDLLVHAQTHDDHIRILNQCFGRLRKFGLKLRIEKCIFGAHEVSYLGYRLTPAGIKPGLEKMEAVRQMPPPDTIRKIREFCGLTNYFRQLIKNYATKIAPLSALTRKDSTWKKGPLPEEALKAFEQIKTTSPRNRS